MTAAEAPAAAEITTPDALPLAARELVTWLETGVRPEGLFSDQLRLDLSVPLWRILTIGSEAGFGIRESQHPFTGRVNVEAVDSTSRGFLLQFEERWDADGQSWYCRELIHAIVSAGQISELVVYCTGDWDEAVQEQFAAQVRAQPT